MAMKEFTNAQIIGIMNTLGGNGKDALATRKMPFKILYSIHRSAPNLEAAYKAYDETLDDICGQYGVTKQNLALEDKEKQAELNKHIAELLGTKVEVDIHQIDEGVLDNYDDTRFDPLTYAEYDVLCLFVKENKESEEE